ncbi:MAG: signal peptidase II [Oscillospiraceae bacterium]|nr:signal peptidase II [Oscillospiraceae bacterium]
MPYFILAAVLVIVDQLVKYFVRANIALYHRVTFLPGVMDLTYVQNTGAAFSYFSSHTWVLAIISAAVSVVLVIVLCKGLFKRPFGLISVALILAGAVGNLIDRLVFGFVTDMFMTTFMDFAIFNVADICVVAGGIAVVVYVLFFYEKWEKRRKGEAYGAADADG